MPATGSIWLAPTDINTFRTLCRFPTVSAWFSLGLRSVRCVKQVLNVIAVVNCHVSQTIRPKGATSARQLLEHARNPATPEPTAARHTATYTARQQQCTAVHAADVMNCQGLSTPAGSPLVLYAGIGWLYCFSTGGSAPDSSVRWSPAKAKPAGKRPDVHIRYIHVQFCSSALLWVAVAKPRIPVKLYKRYICVSDISA